MTEPPYAAAQALGWPRTTDLRDVVNAFLSVLRSGRPWRLMAKDFPPRSTVQRYFAAWRDEGLWAGINHALLTAARKADGGEAAPSAGIIDSQSVKTTESGGPRGFDAAKLVKGRKRHIVTDTGGLLLAARVHAADIQDRDGAPGVLASIRHAFPCLRHVFADGAYVGPELEAKLKRIGLWTLGIVKRSAGAQGFHVLSRRWVVERTLAWPSRNRRLAKDFGSTIATTQA